MNNNNLTKMLHTGMGRAIFLLLKEDLARYRDLILDSCLHNYAYDPQCEGSREDYLFPLLKASGEMDFYRDRILEALKSETEFWNQLQLLRFALLFAKEGNTDARQAIYGTFAQHIEESEHPGADKIVELDKIDGLLFVLDQFAGKPEINIWPSELDYWVSIAEEQSSAEKVQKALAEARKSNPAISALLDKVDQDRNKHDSRPDYVSLPAGTSWNDLKERKNFFDVARVWAKQVSDEEFMKAAADLPDENDAKQLEPWLRIFCSRSYPLDPDYLIKMTKHPDEWTAEAAVTALSTMNHRKVRALALQFAIEPERLDDAISLLESNYNVGDHILIENLLRNAADEDNLHSIGYSAIDIFKAHPSPEALNSLMFIYENGPCSICRFHAVELFDKIDQVPQSMLQECLYDTKEKLREFASEKLKMPS